MLRQRGKIEYQTEMDEKREGIIRTLVQAGIPAFFYISGIASTFFKTEKYNFCIFLKQKFMRLLLPFIVGMIFFLVPRYWLLQEIEEGAFLEGKPTNWNFFTYYVDFLPKMHVKLSWLWFLPALFLDSVVNYPLIKWI